MLLGTIWLYDNNFETFDTEECFVDLLTKRPEARFVEIPDFRGDPLPCFNTSKKFVCTKYQRYTYRVLQTIQMKLILLLVWAEQVVWGSAKTALRFKYEI